MSITLHILGILVLCMLGTVLMFLWDKYTSDGGKKR